MARWKIGVGLLILLFLGLFGGGVVPVGVAADEGPGVSLGRGQMAVWRDSGQVNQLFIPPPLDLGGTLFPSATFQVDYVGFSAEAKEAFQAAVNIWAALINSPIPIKIKAAWQPLEGDVLGMAGPTDFIRDFPGALRPGTWYPLALARKLSGQVLRDNYDIEATFNSQAAWYFGLDGVCPPDKLDFVTVVLHELCHGLGFIGSATVENGVGRIGVLDGQPMIFDAFIRTGTGQAILEFTNNSPELAAQLTGENLFFSGEKANLANGGLPVKTFAPTAFLPGSSYSHLDIIFRGTPNGLMVYALDRGSAIQSPGPLVLGIFQDMGY